MEFAKLNVRVTTHNKKPKLLTKTDV